jgi:predicted RNase H-like HicB family nuclease
MSHYQLTATIWREGDQYVSKCPELGVASAGDTAEEALDALREAVELYLENARELGLLHELQATLTSPRRFSAPLEVTVQ